MVSIFRRKIISLSLYEWLAIVFAVALQVQITLFVQGDYLGLRIGLGDLLLPFVGLGVAGSLLCKKSCFPKFYLPYAYWWFGALALVMSVSLLNGYIMVGEWSVWAVINKYIGFYLLLLYMLLGGWMMHNSERSESVIYLFVKVFLGVFIITSALSFMGVYVQTFSPVYMWLSAYPWDGMMANRNAFMVVFIFSFTLLVWSNFDKKIVVSRWWQGVFWFILPMFFIYNDSRTGWIASGILCLLFLFKAPLRRLRFVLPFVCLGIGMAYGSYFLPNVYAAVMKSAQAQHFLNFLGAPTQDPEYNGDLARYIAVEDGLALYGQSDPLVGAGLGTYKSFQIEKRGEYLNVMDFTGLWLLVETGAVGLFVFAAFFIMCAWCMYRRGFVENEGGYYRAMFVFLVLFAGMSVLHELMYTRFLWFAMGLALAARSCKNSGDVMSSEHS